MHLPEISLEIFYGETSISISLMLYSSSVTDGYVLLELSTSVELIQLEFELTHRLPSDSEQTDAKRFSYQVVDRGVLWKIYRISLT